MIKFTQYSPELASRGIATILQDVQQKYGFIPNFLRYAAASPAVVSAYMELAAKFEQSSLNAIEQQVVLLTASVEDESRFCIAIHSHNAYEEKNMRPEIVNAIRQGQNLPDDRLEALARFTRQLINKRGQVTENALEDFLNTGYSKQQVLDTILGISLAVLTNYVNNVVNTPLNEELQKEEWTPEEKRAA